MKRKVIPPLYIEQYPDDYKGYEFITLLKFNNKVYLTIVDNINTKFIFAYVIDFCESQGVDEKHLIQVANEWYDTNRFRYPISIEFHRKDMIEDVSKILRIFSIHNISRLIGPFIYYDMFGPSKIRKKKRRDPPKQ